MKRGERILIAASRGVTVGTLRRWERAAEDEAPPASLGRPPTTQAERDDVKQLVASELDRQGWTAGEAAVQRSLGPVPLRLVRSALRDLKAERRRVQARRIRRQRTSIEVHARDALWSLDATHLGRDEKRTAVQAEVIREVASTRSLEIQVGPAASGAQVVALLERCRVQRGCLPLVLATDNGSDYTSSEVGSYLAKHQVVHLRSRPHTPQQRLERARDA